MSVLCVFVRVGMYWCVMWCVVVVVTTMAGLQNTTLSVNVDKLPRRNFSVTVLLI